MLKKNVYVGLFSDLEGSQIVFLRQKYLKLRIF